MFPEFNSETNPELGLISSWYNFKSVKVSLDMSVFTLNKQRKAFQKETLGSLLTSLEIMESRRAKDKKLNINGKSGF